MTRLIQLRFDNPRNKIQVLKNVIGNFVDLNEQTVFNNDVIEGIFTCKVHSSGKMVLSFDTITVNRFAILLAFLHDDAWRLRLGLVVTTEHGVFGFKATKTLYKNEHGKFHVPKNWVSNTVLMLGIRCNNEDADLTVRTNAIKPYEGQIAYDHLRADIFLSDNIKPVNC